MTQNVYIAAFILLPLVLLAGGVFLFLRRGGDLLQTSTVTPQEVAKEKPATIDWDRFDELSYIVAHLRCGRHIHFSNGILKKRGFKASHILKVLMAQNMIAISMDDCSVYSLCESADTAVQDILEAYMHTDVSAGKPFMRGCGQPDPMKVVRFSYPDGSIRVYHMGVFLLWDEPPYNIFSQMSKAGMFEMDEEDHRCLHVSADMPKQIAMEALLDAYMDPYQALMYVDPEAA